MIKPIPADPNIGIVLSTFCAVPYVHLQLECLRRHNPNVNVLIHDDSSPHGDKLQELANEYDALKVSTPTRAQPTIGDLSAFVWALEWGEANDLDIVIKCSRSMVIDKPFTAGLAELMHNTQYATATGADCTFSFGFRSELVAMHTSAWIESGVIDDMRRLVADDREYGFPESEYHNWARRVHKFITEGKDVHNWRPENGDTLARYLHCYEPNRLCDGFAHWPLMGLGRSQPVTCVLWHDATNPATYAELAQKYDLPYTVEDYRDRNSGFADRPAPKPPRPSGEVLPVLTVYTPNETKGTASMTWEPRGGGLNPADNTIEDYYARASNPSIYGDSGICGHIPTIASCIREGDTVCEIGIGGGDQGTLGILQARPAHLHSFDVNEPASLAVLQALAKKGGIDFTFHQGMSQDAGEIAATIEADVTMIDSWHDSLTVAAELAIFAPITKRTLIFHDVVAFGEHGQGGLPDTGINLAIAAFLFHNPSWRVMECFDNDNGLLILERV